MNLTDKQREKSETSYVHHLDVEVFYFNEKGILKPSAYQALFAKLAERHLDIYNTGADQTMKHDLAWALISMTIDVKQPMDACMNLWANTWYSQRQGPYFRRELVFYNENDDIMFQGSTFSVLLNVNERKVYRKKDLPFPLTEPHANFCTHANHRFKESAEFMPYEDRKIYDSDLDLLGHVNNRRYGDFAYDALTEEEQSRLNNVKRMELYFISEMRKNDNFTVLKSVQENRILLQGQNNTKGDTAFDIVFQF